MASDLLGELGSLEAEAPSLIRPSDRELARLGQSLRGEVDGMATFGNGGGDVRGREREVDDPPDIAIGDPLGPGDIGNCSFVTGQQTVPPIVRPDNGLDKARVGIGVSLRVSAFDREPQSPFKNRKIAPNAVT